MIIRGKNVNINTISKIIRNNLNIMKSFFEYLEKNNLGSPPKVVEKILKLPINKVIEILGNCYYLVNLVDDAQDGREVEKLLDNLQKTVLQTLKDKFELRNPTDASDPKCSWSMPERVSVFEASQNGMPIQARAIHFHIIVHTS